MAEPIQPSNPYLAEHVRDALTSDPRTVGLEFDVAQVGEAIHVRGTVSTEQRRSATQDVLDECFPGERIVNDLVVQEFPEPTRVEHIA